MVFVIVLLTFFNFLFLEEGAMGWRADVGGLGKEWGWGVCCTIPKEFFFSFENYVKKKE